MNTLKNVEVTMNFREKLSPTLPYITNKNTASAAQTFSWHPEPAQEGNLLKELLIQFYTATIQAVPSTFITVWFGPPNRTGTDHNWQSGLQWKSLHSGFTHLRSQETDRKHHCRSLKPWTQSVSTSALREVLQKLCVRTTRHNNRFFPQAITMMNS